MMYMYIIGSQPFFSRHTIIYQKFSRNTHALDKNKNFGYVLRYPVGLKPYSLPTHVSTYLHN
jgi:hypothetical protein